MNELLWVLVGVMIGMIIGAACCMPSLRHYERELAKLGR